jgi:hypothetical protein
MTTKYNATVEVDLIPTYHASAPEIKYGINGLTHHLILSEKTTIVVEDQLPLGKHHFAFDFFNKTDADCDLAQGLDKFITVSSVKIGGLVLPRFLWITEYEPRYPEPWYSEQESKPPQIQSAATVLGFNGTWRLPFESPIFPWIHQLESMGWIWPVP